MARLGRFEQVVIWFTFVGVLSCGDTTQESGAESSESSPAGDAVEPMSSGESMTASDDASTGGSSSAGGASMSIYPDVVAMRLLRTASADEIEQAVRAIVQQMCAKFDACCEIPEQQGRASECEAAAFGELLNEWTGGLESGVSIDEDNLELCRRGIEDAACTDLALEIGACELAFVGNGLAGSSCERSFDCLAPVGGGAECSSELGCVQLPRGRLGDACDRTCGHAPGVNYCNFPITDHGESLAIATCWREDALHCDPERGCSALKSQGSDCQYFSDCEEGLLCLDGRCDLPLTIGDECRRGECGADASCVNDNCQQVLEGGNVCDEDEQCRSGSCAGVCLTVSNFCGTY